MYSEIVAKQEFALKVLNAHLAKNRVAHTYLLSGESQTGNAELAEAFACALQCQKAEVLFEEECLDCRKIQERNHPDVHWIGDDLKVRSIKIEEIREMIKASVLKPYEGEWKIFIIRAAERLTTDAANALLKTLEEPPAKSIFILLVETKSHLLETIQSRAFEIRLKPTPDAEMTSVESFDITDWGALLEPYHAKPRIDVKEKLIDLLATLEREFSGDESACVVQAVEKIIETKAALDENANQKLALTRLEMQLRNVMPLS